MEKIFVQPLKKQIYTQEDYHGTWAIFYVNLRGCKRFCWVAPQKSNIDTKNGHTWKESIFSKLSFWGPPAVSCRGRKVKFLPPFESAQMSYEVGPLPVITVVITPISRVFSPQLPVYFRPFIGVISPFINGSGAHLPTGSLPNRFGPTMALHVARATVGGTYGRGEVWGWVTGRSQDLRCTFWNPKQQVVNGWKWWFPTIYPMVHIFGSSSNW